MYNILICDDDRDIVNALKIYLQDPSYKLFEAYNGNEALRVINSNDIHLVLMDIMMPKLDGIKATIKIREEKNHIQYIKYFIFFDYYGIIYISKL